MPNRWSMTDPSFNGNYRLEPEDEREDEGWTLEDQREYEEWE